MAIIHRATLEPGKADLIGGWLDRRRGGGGAPELLGSYRFDDPDGEVGVEGFVVRRDGLLVHVALTYRAAPLAGADASLVGTTEHSVLGTRWVYAAAEDPVAVDCFTRALHGRQDPADMELWDGDRLVRRTATGVRVRVEPAGGATVDAAGDDAGDSGGRDELTLVEELDPADKFPTAAARLVADWEGGRAVVAVLGRRG
jgi:hypothetical protein